MYSAIAKARLQPGDWLVIPGAGGGLGHLSDTALSSVCRVIFKALTSDRGVQIAAKRGYRVIAIDTGEAKRDMCLKLGATVFLDFKTDEVSTHARYLPRSMLID